MRKIIVVTGLPGSGKSEVSREFKRRKIPTFISGNIVRDEVLKRGMDLTAESSEFVARQLRKEYGPDAPVRLLESRIESSPSGIICVEGPRNLREVHLLARHGEIYLVVVESARKLRYGRLRRRASPRDPARWSEFEWRDRRELQRGMRSLLITRKFRRYLIKNTGTVSELRSKAARILSQVRAHEPGSPGKGKFPRPGK